MAPRLQFFQNLALLLYVNNIHVSAHAYLRLTLGRYMLMTISGVDLCKNVGGSKLHSLLVK